MNKPEAFDGQKWREVQIEQWTPKNRNYPNGGAYVRWVDAINAPSYVSKSGWISAHNLRNCEGINAPMAGY